MEKYIVTTTGRTLAENLIGSLGATSLKNGDRVSDYFKLAHNKKGNLAVSVSLTENIHGLDKDKAYYTVQIIDDISGDDCELRYTNTLDRDELTELLDQIIQSLSCVAPDDNHPEPLKYRELLNALTFWANYEYEDSPLAFLKMDTVLPSDSKVTILRLFDRWYGDTDQDTPVWATEYQLLARMLLTDNALLVNPRYLDMDDLNQDYETVLFALGDRNAEKYTKARALTESELNRIYQEAEAK